MTKLSLFYSSSSVSLRLQADHKSGKEDSWLMQMMGSLRETSSKKEKYYIEASV